MTDEPTSEPEAEPGLNRRSFLGLTSAGLAGAALLPLSASAPPPASPPNSRGHPFLICTRDQFPALRKRAAREPWATMKENALQNVRQGRARIDIGRHSKRSALTADAIRLQKYLGACGLAYIVDPENRGAHAGRIHKQILGALSHIPFDESERWSGVVAPTAAAFSAIIALDVAYDDLSASQVQECEDVLDTQIGKIEREGSWELARLGIHGTWEVYRGLRTEPDDTYYRHYLSQMTDDGVSTTASYYAWSRLGTSAGRVHKSGYADVLEFTGIDNRYYDHPRLQKFCSWLFGPGVTPAKHLHVFGDFSIVKQYPLAENAREQLEASSTVYRAGRFGPQAGHFAAWALEDRDPPGHILGYVLKEQNYEPQVPTSALFEDGGAFFREPDDAPTSLGAMLYNITERPDWHTHQETNAISLSAYGGRLLINGGYLGPAVRPARRNNTITINGQEHEERTGKGLTDGLTSEGFDVATGHSGEALPGDGWFERTLMLIHGQGGANGYFATVDEVQARPGDTINHALHPATGTAPKEIEPKAEYEARIDRFTEEEGNRLSVFYGQAPHKVDRTSVPTGTEDLNVQDHYRQKAHFGTNHKGKTRLITVLFPHDETHPKVRFVRHTGDTERQGSPSGVSISHDEGPVDHIYESAGDASYEINGDAQFQGRVACFRETESGTPFFFVRRGLAFRRGAVGFTANRCVTLHLRGRSGHITAEEPTPATFYHPEVRDVRMGEETLSLSDRGDGWVQVPVPAGHNQAITLIGAD